MRQNVWRKRQSKDPIAEYLKRPLRERTYLTCLLRDIAQGRTG